MTDRDNLRDRLDALEDQLGSDTTPTVDEETMEWFEKQYEHAREILPPEKVDRLDELEAEMDRTGVYADEQPAGPPNVPEPSEAWNRWWSIWMGDAAAVELERGGL